MEPERAERIDEYLPPSALGTLILSDTLLGKSDSAAVVIRSILGYDEGIKIETEFLLRSPGVQRRPLREAVNPQHADPVISFGAGSVGDFHPLTWNDTSGPLNIVTLSADEGHSRLVLRTWITPTPDELVVGIRWSSFNIASKHLAVACRHPAQTWSLPLWP